MKKLRILVLLGVAVALAAVVSDYAGFREAGLRVRLAEPDTLPPDLNSQAISWKWSQSSGNRRSVEGTAQRFRQTKEGLVFELEGVELKVFHEDEKAFDLIETPAALFDTRAEKLYSDAEVVITMGLSTAADDDPSGDRTVIRSTGVTFESKAATCSTERYTEYEFEGGWGHSTGAFYDSVNRYFRMKSDVYLERVPEGSAGSPLKIRAGELTYHEREQRVDLRERVSLRRGPEHLTAEEAFVFLEQGKIRRIDAIDGRGGDTQPHKVIHFSAQRLQTQYTPAQTLEQVVGLGAAELRSRTSSSDTKVNGERIQLDYVTPVEATQGELREAHVQQGARIEVRSLAKNDETADVRRISAEWIHLTMRPGGEDMQMLETLTPGRLELLPQDPSGLKRILTGDRITAQYSPGNRMEKLRAEGSVSLESSAAARRRGSSAGDGSLRSWSDRLAVEFDPASGEMRQLKQWANFRFERGGRRGNSKEAWFDPDLNRVELRGEARVWDASGNVFAQAIVLDEKTGDLTAEGSVSSHYLEPVATQSGPSTGSSGIFSPGEPVFGTADRMISRQGDGRLHYLGQARLWQKEQRIEAEQIEIDRRAKTLSAEGNVVSFLRANESAEGRAESAGKTASTMRIKSASMRYREASEQVVFQGGVELRRARLTVRSDRLEAFLQPPDQAESSPNRLERILAKERVAITELTKGHGQPRRGFGAEAIYEPADERVSLHGRPARIVDEAGSETRGAQLTYYLNDDRLLVQGSGDDRAYTLRRQSRP